MTKVIIERPDQTFPKSLRLVSGDDFTKVLRGGGVAANGTIVVFVLPRKTQHAGLVEKQPNAPEIPPSRLGVTIPKKTGNAVVRNQWKRHVRESFRTQKDQIPLGYDIVVRPKKDAVLDQRDIHKGLPKMIAKAIRRLKSPQN